jgi:hypothetical protein
MPIDPTIFLRSYQGAPDLANTFLRARELKRRGQLEDQQIQEGQMRIDEMRSQKADREGIKQAFRNSVVTPQPQTVQQPTVDVGGVSIPGGQSTVQGPPTLDRGALYSNLAQVAPEQVPAYQHQFAQSDMAQQNAQAQFEKTRAETLNALSQIPVHQANVAEKKLEMTGQLLVPLLNVKDPNQQKQVYEQQVAPQLAQMAGMPADQFLQAHPYEGPDMIQAKVGATKAGIEFLKQKQEQANSDRTFNLDKQKADQTTKFQNSELNLRGQTLNLEKKKLEMMTGTGEGNGGLVDEIGKGKMAPERMGYLLARNPQLMSAVAAKYPDFDSSKIQGYIAATKDFTSGTTSKQLNAGGTALKHLEELNNLNTDKSHIPGTSDYNRYQNKVDTVASELAKFYGDATIPAIASIKSTLAAQLPGNRKAAIQEQAKSMGDKLDSYEQQWKNAAPSSSYQAPMPGIDAGAKAARAKLDPAYAARTQSQSGPKVGDIEDGHRFKGGNPADPNSWEKVNK